MAQRDDCRTWERGENCNFDMFALYVTILVLFGLTAFLFVTKAFLPLYSAPKGKARWCLLLLSISANLEALNALLTLTVTGYKHYVLSFVGGIFLVSGLWLFTQRWCDVADGLRILSGSSGRDAFGKRIRGIRYAYAVLAVGHVPAVVMRTTLAPTHTTSVVFASWVALEAVVMTFVAVLMWFATAISLQGGCDKHASRCLYQFRLVTKMNLYEQISYNAGMITVAMLFFRDDYWTNGEVQATYFWLYYAVYWLMHVQVLAFFFIIEPSHPLCDKEALMGFLNDAAQETPLPIVSKSKAAAIGSPSTTAAEPLAGLPGHDVIEEMLKLGSEYSDGPEATPIGSPSVTTADPLLHVSPPDILVQNGVGSYAACKL